MTPRDRLITELSTWDAVESVKEENEKLIIYVTVGITDIYPEVIKTVRALAPGTAGEVRKKK